jgi:hypothetical protein
MTKKILNIEAISNELEGASLFFTRPATKLEEPIKEKVVETVSPSDNPVSKKNDISNLQALSPKNKSKTVNKRNDTVIPRYHDTTTPRYHDTITEIVRKAVKEFGKEAATHRFTVAEKRAVADIIYTYKSRGTRTSENEIARIAVNFLIEDFKANGESSVLDKVLKALNG